MKKKQRAGEKIIKRQTQMNLKGIYPRCFMLRSMKAHFCARHSLRFFILLVVGTVLLIGLSSCSRVAEDGHALIVLKSEMTAISPDPLRVKRGTTIIWVNEGKEPISIIIKASGVIGCKSLVNFYKDLLGDYETGQIHSGATASICFIHKGNFNYEVKKLIGKDKLVEKVLRASIIVE